MRTLEEQEAIYRATLNAFIDACVDGRAGPKVRAAIPAAMELLGDVRRERRRLADLDALEETRELLILGVPS